MIHRKIRIKLIVLIYFVFTSNQLAAEQICGVKSNNCRIDVGYIHDWSHDLEDSKASKTNNFGKWYVYGREHGIRPEFLSKSKFSGYYELEYSDRTANDEFFGSVGTFWTKDRSRINPDVLPGLGIGALVNLSKHESLKENSSFTFKLLHRNENKKSTKDFLLDIGYTFSDWKNEHDGETFRIDLQGRYGSGNGLEEQIDYGVVRLVVDHFNYDNNNYKNQTTISFQPLIRRTRLCHPDSKSTLFKSLFDWTCNIRPLGYVSDIYFDVIVGKDWTLNDSGRDVDSRSYFGMLGLSISLNNFEKFDPNDPPIGGGGGSGGRYFRP